MRGAQLSHCPSVASLIFACCSDQPNSSYKRVKGRSHTGEERTRIHSRRPHATSQPAITVFIHAQLHHPSSTVL